MKRMQSAGYYMKRKRVVSNDDVLTPPGFITVSCKESGEAEDRVPEGITTLNIALIEAVQNMDDSNLSEGGIVVLYTGHVAHTHQNRTQILRAIRNQQR